MAPTASSRQAEKRLAGIFSQLGQKNQGFFFYYFSKAIDAPPVVGRRMENPRSGGHIYGSAGVESISSGHESGLVPLGFGGFGLSGRKQLGAHTWSFVGTLARRWSFGHLAG